MKLTVVITVLIALGIIAWGVRAAGADHAPMLVLAVLSVTFFSALPVVLGVLSRRRGARPRRGNATVVRLPARQSPPPDAP